MEFKDEENGVFEEKFNKRLKLDMDFHLESVCVSVGMLYKFDQKKENKMISS